MIMWIIIFWTAMAVMWLAFVYLGTRVSSLIPLDIISHWGIMKQALVCGGIVLLFAALLTWCFDAVNAMVCLLYLALIWVGTDALFWLVQRIFHVTLAYPYHALIATGLTVALLSVGWYLNHQAWATHYTLITDKEVPPLKIAMFADVHLGTTFHADGFAKRLKMIQAQNPDIVFVVGDYVDDNTRRDDMLKGTQALGQLKTKYGVYFVMGNHDKGYFHSAQRGFTKQDLIDTLEKAGVIVLQDEKALVDDAFYIIGRQDASVQQEGRGHRLSMDDLTQDLDKNKYSIVLDHQPADFENQQGRADLVLSGHTHGGQLFPFNWVGRWIGANDSIYGHTRRKNTDFIVTSGLSSWAIQFKTGTKSEFVVIDILPAAQK